MANRNPFTVFDAEIRLYLVDAAGDLSGEVYLGGCIESVTFEQAFTPRRLEYPGLRYAVDHHEDEEHTIELRNPWLHEAQEIGARMPRGHERGARYIMVILWRDDELGIWNKRTYYGVTSRGQKVEDSFQVLKFRAESLIETAGMVAGGVPALLPSVQGLVRYIDGAGAVDLYLFDGDTAILSVIDEDLIAGRAAITVDATAVEITFDGERALYGTAAGTEVGELLAIGQTFVDEVPRLEFFMGQNRIASLAASGVLAVVNFDEGTSPVATDDFEVKTASGAWLFSLALPKSFFPAISEVAA